MSILSWLGKRIGLGLSDRGFWATWYGGETWAGEPVSPETAMQVSAFWALVRLHAQTIGTLPLGFYERMPDGSRKTRDDHDLARIIGDTPNADHTAVEFWEGVVGCLCLFGNAFAEKAMQGRRLIALTMLNPPQMTVTRDASGALRYRYSEGAKVREFREDQIFHVRGFGLGGDIGLSPVAYARQSLSATRATDRAAAQHFANGMRPSGWLKYKGGILKPEQREQVRKNIIAPMQGAENSGNTAVLEGDFDYTQATIPPETAQMLESRGFNVEDLCRWFNTPPVLIGHSSPGQTMFGSGVEQVMRGWYTLGLNPLLVRIEKAIKRSLIAAEERGKLYAKFNVEGLLRADSAARAELYWKLVQIASLTPNQVCELEDFPKFEGGDVRLVNTTLQPLDQAGQKSATQPAQPEAPATPQQRKLEVVK